MKPPEAGAEPLSPSEFLEQYGLPLRIRDGLHKRQIIQLLAAHAAHVSQAYERRIKELEQELAEDESELNAREFEIVRLRAQLAEAREVLRNITLCKFIGNAIGLAREALRKSGDKV